MVNAAATPPTTAAAPFSRMPRYCKRRARAACADIGDVLTPLLAVAKLDGRRRAP